MIIFRPCLLSTSQLRCRVSEKYSVVIDTSPYIRGLVVAFCAARTDRGGISACPSSPLQIPTILIYRLNANTQLHSNGKQHRDDTEPTLYVWYTRTASNDNLYRRSRCTKCDSVASRSFPFMSSQQIRTPYTPDQELGWEESPQNYPYFVSNIT